MATSLDFRKRSFLLLPLLALAAGSSVACSADAGNDGSAAASESDVTSVDHSEVKRQSIGNCWLYATTSWLEALHKGASNEELNTSESYLTYWDWFEKIVSRDYTASGVQTGGWFSTGTELVSKYGVILEKDFIPEEADAEMSARQKSALEIINASLKSGALSKPGATSDRALVRSELDRAFALSSAVTSMLDDVFGADVSKHIDSDYATKKPAAPIIRPKDLSVRLKDAASGKFVSTPTLADAASTSGKFAWEDVYYPSGSARRAFQIRVQKALHDQMPVVISWKVDFNALSQKAVFSKSLLDDKGPGRQGGHLTVLHDYEVDAPGFGILKAGVTETRPEALAAALDPSASIKFFRVKNSWGSIRPDRWKEAAINGYHDLDIDYLNGPIKWCNEKDGETDTTDCERDVTPLQSVVLPAGY